MGTSESNKPLIGGLTFLGATVIQISVGLISQAVKSGNGISEWVEAHPFWAVSVLLLISTLLTSATLWLTNRRSPEEPEDELLDSAARELVTSLSSQLDEESQLRLLDSPRPIPIRWQNADDSLIDQWRNILLDPRSDRPIELDGEGDQILQAFRRVPSGRLVVLGRAGAGKSVLMMRFVGSVLAEEARERIPVLLALATWDPASTPFNVWMARELAVQHPSLGQRTAGGRSLATRLIDRGRLIYVLDGLDEMPSGLRSEALRAISMSLRRVDSVLLTCRLAEYRAAVADGGVLAGSAAVVIKDLHPSDVEDYLSSTSGDAHHGSRWTEVLADIDNAAPGTTPAALQRALRTPLMVQMARTIYQNPKSRPEELLKLSDTKSVEDLLLDQYVAAALDPGPGMRSRHQRSLRRTERYLTHIAQYMTEAETPYFRWWDLHRCLNLKARLILGVFVGFLVVIAEFVLLGFASLPDTSYEDQADSGLTASQENILNVLFVMLPLLGGGLAVGFFVARYVHKRNPSNSVAILVPVRLRRSWRRNVGGRLTRRSGRQTFLLALRLGIIVGLVLGLALAVPFAIESVFVEEEFGPSELIVVTLFFWLWISLGTALVFTIALWAAFLLSQLIEEPVVLTEVWSPVALLESDRRTALLEAVIGAVVAIIICAIMTIPEYLIQSLLFGGAGGEVSFSDVFFGSAFTTIPLALTLTVVMIIVMTAWGRFTLARLYLGCTGRFPFRLLRFLSSMREKGVMRQTGPAFQFRHLRLRDRLALHEPGSQTR